jgi:hypothetical protein
MRVLGSSRLVEVSKDTEFDINFGEIKKGSDISEKIILEGDDLAHLAISKSCGCTMPSVQILVNGVEITIAYDSNKVGVINQWVNERYLEDGVQKNIKINLKGVIKE